MRLKSPMHIADPERAYADTDTGYIYSSRKNSNMVDCTRTRRLKAVMPIENEESQQRLMGIPVIPANTIRGGIRRAATTTVLDVLAERGELVPLDVYHCMRCGSHTGQPDKTPDIRVIERSQQHPFVGLLGGGPQMAKSAYVCEEAIAICEGTIEADLVPEQLSSLAPSKDMGNREPRLTTPVWFIHSDDVLDNKDSRISAVVENFPESVTDWFEKVEANQQARKSERNEGGGDTKKQSIKSFLAHEVALPGVQMSTSFSVDTALIGEAGFGLFLSALAHYCQSPIGGWVRNGYGQLSVNATCESDDGTNHLILKDNELNYSSEFVTRHLDAWAQRLDAITAQELKDTYTLAKSA